MAEDEMVSEMLRVYEAKGIPTMAEAIVNLQFFTTFSYGCRRLKLPEIADKFNQRAADYITGLSKLGWTYKKRRFVGREGRRGMLMELVEIVSARVKPV